MRATECAPRLPKVYYMLGEAGASSTMLLLERILHSVSDLNYDNWRRAAG